MEVRRGGLVRGVAWHKRVKRRQTGRTLVASACESSDKNDEPPLYSRLEGALRVFGGGGGWQNARRQQDATAERL